MNILFETALCRIWKKH